MKVIDELIRKVNLVLPEYALRRNSLYYEYICYINHTYTFFTCGLYNETSLFINRAYRFLDKNKEEIDLSHQYLVTSKELLDNISNYLRENNLVNLFDEKHW